MNDMPHKDHSYAARVATRHHEEVAAMEGAAALFGWSGFPWEDLTDGAARLMNFLAPAEGEPGEAAPELVLDAEKHLEAFRELRKGAGRIGLDSRPFARASGQADDLLHAIKNLLPVPSEDPSPS